MRRTEFEKAMESLREEMKKSLASFQESFSKEVDSRIQSAIAQASDQISADVVKSISMEQIEFRESVQTDIRSIGDSLSELQCLLKERGHSRSPRRREKSRD